MTPFSFVRADSLSHAIQEGRGPNTRFIAGGTNLVDLMKQNVDQPSRLIDISALDLGAIAERDGGGVSLGALASNADTAYHPWIKERYPLLASAILAGASPQLRNAATNGGNLTNEHAAIIITIRPRLVTSVSRARDAALSVGSIVSTPSWEQAQTASRHTRLTCAWRCRRSMRLFT